MSEKADYLFTVFCRELFLFLGLFNYSILILIPAAMVKDIIEMGPLLSLLVALVVARVLFLIPDQLKILSIVATTPVRQFKKQALAGLLMVNLPFLILWLYLGWMELHATSNWSLLSLIPMLVFVIYMKTRGYNLIGDPVSHDDQSV